MEIRWKIFFTKTLVWLLVEILLNFIGLDTIADYSEFIFNKNTIIHLS